MNFLRRIATVTTVVLIIGCTYVPAHQAADAVVDDTEITLSVRAALLKDLTIRSWQLQVETRQGTVLLRGFVDSVLDKERADEVTRDVAGVRSVRNDLVVRSGSRPR